MSCGEVGVLFTWFWTWLVTFLGSWTPGTFGRPGTWPSSCCRVRLRSIGRAGACALPDPPLGAGALGADGAPALEFCGPEELLDAECSRAEEVDEAGAVGSGALMPGWVGPRWALHSS